MGYVEKRSGRYRARYRDPVGRQRSETFTRKADAERFLREQQVEVTPKSDGAWGAAHGGEFNFFLNDVDGGVDSLLGDLYGDRPDRYDVQDVLHQMFLRFAHEGDPGTAAVPWPAYDAEDAAGDAPGQPLHRVNDPGGELRELYLDLDVGGGAGTYLQALRYDDYFVV